MSAVSAEETPQAALDPATLHWIREVTGAVSVRAERHSGGASRAGYSVDIVRADGTRRALWLRADTGHGPQSRTLYTVRREGLVYRALEGTGVRAPVLVALHPTEDKLLSERLEGRNWFSQIRSADEQAAVATEYMAQLAELHALDPADLDLPGFGTPGRISDHVREELDIWEAQYRAQGEPEPLVALAFTWLRQHLPPDGDWPVVLVHGDAGPGNFMYAHGKLVAVMDWEMAHFGDLHDDLGWLCVRDLQERFTHLPDRLRDYERASGRALDRDRLRYFRSLAQLRCAVGTLTGLRARDSRGEIANHLIYSTLHLRLLAEALAEAKSLPLMSESLPDPGVSEETWMYDVALEDLRAVIVPALSDGFAVGRAKGLARLVKYLREANRLGPSLARDEAADLARLLGSAVGDLRAARTDLCRAIELGKLDEDAALQFCLRHVGRMTQVARPAMGALADRHYAPLED